MTSLFNNPISAALFGWLAFNVIILSMYKDDNENAWAFKQYVSEHWDNWAASFFAIPCLLYVGMNQLSLPMTDLTNPKWSDLYYLGSGFFVEAIKMAYKKWIAKTKTQ